MKVVLIENVKNLGVCGDIVDVKRGYAINYLIRQNLAAEATPQNLNIVKTRQKAMEAKAAQWLEEATETAKKLQGKVVTLEMKTGEEGRLYGSVTNQDIADALEAMGFTVDKREITMKDKIEGVGNHDCEVRLHPEVVVPFVVEIKGI